MLPIGRLGVMLSTPGIRRLSRRLGPGCRQTLHIHRLDRGGLSCL